MGVVVSIAEARKQKHLRTSATMLRDAGIISDELILALLRTWSHTGRDHKLNITTAELPYRQRILFKTDYPESVASRVDDGQPWYMSIDVLYRSIEEVEELRLAARDYTGRAQILHELGFDSYLADQFGIDTAVSLYVTEFAVLLTSMLESGQFQMLYTGINTRDCYLISLLGPDGEYLIEFDGHLLQAYHEKCAQMAHRMADEQIPQ